LKIGSICARFVAGCNLQLICIRLEFVMIGHETTRQRICLLSRSRDYSRSETMSENKTAPKTSKPDLNSHYKPLGLKAVAAASMMQKSKPAQASVKKS
jgi:hypothetical protein